MAWQQYQYSPWTPLAGGDGDLGLASNPLSNAENTSYHGDSRSQSSIPHRPQLSLDSGSYEMEDRSSYISSAPLLQNGTSSTLKPSIGDPSILESISGGLQRHWRQLSGWKVGVAICAVTASTVCLLNILLTIWAVANHKTIGGISYLYTGSCSEVANMSLWIHLGINAMSTILLSASNYTMQVISSPTRSEVNKAHASSKWLDIGIPSTRNLGAISWTRVIMWTTLGLSSVPLHLMYNTAVFSSLSANTYDFIIVSEDFLSPSAIYNASVTDVSSTILDTMHEEAVKGTLTNATSAQCMAMYAVNFVSMSRNVLLVTNEKNTGNNSALSSGSWIAYYEVPYWWICGDGWDPNPYYSYLRSPVCTLSTATGAASNWILYNYKISYCMVQEAVEECQLSFSLLIMLIVISANAMKACIMILTVLKLKEPTLVTLGDAVASFLQDPDPTTKGICLSSKGDIQKKLRKMRAAKPWIWSVSSKEDTQKNGWKMQAANPWIPKKHFWFRAASIKRWLICNVLCMGAIGFGTYLLTLGMENLGVYNIKDLYNLGFGSVNVNSVIGSAPTDLVSAALFANLPQFILSFLYLTYNGLFTCMLGALEWSGFAGFRQGLRVTAPIGSQRSTYYLQLPYKYAIPLLVLSGSLHWLMSQSLFLALLTVYDDKGTVDVNSSISTVGYSCIAIFFALIVGTIAVLGGIANGFRRYDDGIPLVGSCSAAISAACHRSGADSMAYMKPVMWGVVNKDGDDMESDVGHCAFSSFEVRKPVKGGLYAGINPRQVSASSA